MSVCHILAAGNCGQRSRPSAVSNKSMFAHPDDRLQGGKRIREASGKRWTEAHPQKTHFGCRASRESARSGEPSAGPHMLSMRLPTARDQEIHVEQMAHASSSSKRLTLSVVIAGALDAATSTGRPNFPCVNRAPRDARDSSTRRRPSSVSSTLSPGRRLSARRKSMGITSCPLLESRDELMIYSYTSYQRLEMTSL
jgi:hypothetical protein